jgi:hypothetical protein
MKTLNGLGDIIEFIRHYGMLTCPRPQPAEALAPIKSQG